MVGSDLTVTYALCPCGDQQTYWKDQEGAQQTGDSSCKASLCYIKEGILWKVLPFMALVNTKLKLNRFIYKHK